LGFFLYEETFLWFPALRESDCRLILFKVRAVRFSAENPLFLLFGRRLFKIPEVIRIIKRLD